MKKQRPTYKKPAKKFDKARILEESKLVSIYGLKNKRELWKAKQIISSFRNSARKFFTDETGKEEIFAKLKRQGILKGDFGLDDILGLQVKDLLERRLQTIVYRKGLANSIRQARQLIIHNHIMVGDRVVSIPSYHVKVDEEPLVKYADNSPISDPNHPLRKAEAKEEEPEKKEGAEDKQEDAAEKLKEVDEAVEKSEPLPEEEETEDAEA